MDTKVQKWKAVTFANLCVLEDRIFLKMFVKMSCFYFFLHKLTVYLKGSF